MIRLRVKHSDKVEGYGIVIRLRVKHSDKIEGEA